MRHSGTHFPVLARRAENKAFPLQHGEIPVHCADADFRVLFRDKLRRQVPRGNGHVRVALEKFK